MNEEILFLTEEGYYDFLADIEKEELELLHIQQNKFGICREGSAEGNGFNAALSDLRTKEERLIYSINKKRTMSRNIVIVPSVVDEEAINVNDYVELELGFSQDDLNKQIIKLIGGNSIDMSAEVQEITLNSPIGDAIYKKKINESGVVNANGSVIYYNIVNKASSLEELEEFKKTK